MAKMICGHRQFISLRRTFGLLQLRLVDRGITNNGIKGGRKTLHSPTHTLQITEIHQNVLETFFRDP
ncbi:hypothetical protein WH5701_16330, partial [Synechococcus sp. WH 5701]